MRKMVYAELSNFRGYEQQIKTIDRLLSVRPSKDDELLREKLYRRIGIIEGWMALLSVDEAFVVNYHIMQGIDWSRIEAEHRRLWGANGRSSRSLQWYQKTAIDKIVAHVVKSEMSTVKKLFDHMDSEKFMEAT